jgi:hypothetical protein
MIPIADYGMPKFYDKLDKTIGGTPNPNLIYPVKEGVFTHILYDHGDGRNTYIPIEPILMVNIDPLMLEVEKKLLEISDRLGISRSRPWTKNARRSYDAWTKYVLCMAVMVGTGAGIMGTGRGKMAMETAEPDWDCLRGRLAARSSSLRSRRVN